MCLICLWDVSHPRWCFEKLADELMMKRSTEMDARGMSDTATGSHREMVPGSPCTNRPVTRRLNCP